MLIRKPIYVLIALAVVVYLVSSFSGKQDKTQAVEGAIGTVSSSQEVTPDMRQPVRITASKDGNLFVSDYKESTVFILDGELNVKKSFTVPDRPMGVAWGKGKVFVGSESTRRVEVYNRNGKSLYELGAKVASPTDIAIDEGQDRVFVVDGQERTVKVFDTSGNFVSVIPQPGLPQETLLNPTGIAVDANRGEVAISDFGDPFNRVPASIKIYDYQGLFRFSIVGDAVQPDYLFSRPQGLAIDASGNFLMVDSMLGKVLVFDRNTKLGIRALGTFGTAPGELKLPLDVLIDPASGDVFVTNTRNGRVEAFRGGGLP